MQYSEHNCQGVSNQGSWTAQRDWNCKIKNRWAIEGCWGWP